MGEHFLSAMRENWMRMDSTQKVGACFFGVVAITGFVLALNTVRQSTLAPFQQNKAVTPYRTESEQVALDAQKERASDTDKDGLSDYDERALYRTSKYLTDSDNDGIGDGLEVQNGKNPNCPEGSDCSAQDASAVGPGQGVEGFAGLLPTDSAMTAEIKTPEDLEKYLNALTLDQIRAALEQSGVAKETLAGLTDTQLRELFDRALKNLRESGQLSEVLNTAKQ